MEFRPARKKEIRQCVKLSAKSFESYIFYRMFPMKEKTRLRFIRAIMNTGIRCAFDQNALFVTTDNDQIVTVTILESPRHQAPDSFTYLKKGGWRVLLVGGKGNTSAWMNMLEECDAAIHHLPEEHWYLSSLTTAEGQKGKGYGSSTIQKGILPYIRSAGGGLLTLITNSEENKQFYEKNGFQVFDEREIVRSGKRMTNWSFSVNIPSE